MVSKNARHHFRFFCESAFGIGLLYTIMKSSCRNFVMMVDVVRKTQEINPARDCERYTCCLKKGSDIIVICCSDRKERSAIGHEEVYNVAAEQDSCSRRSSFSKSNSTIESVRRKAFKVLYEFLEVPHTR